MQVVLPLSLQRRVEGLLQEHLDRQQLNFGKANENEADSQLSKQTEELPDESSDAFLDGSVMEKVLQRRSMRMRNMQRAWQVISLNHLYLWPSYLNYIKMRLAKAVAVWLNNRNRLRGVQCWNSENLCLHSRTKKDFFKLLLGTR